MNYMWILLLASCVLGALTGAISSFLVLRRWRGKFSLRTSAQLSAEIAQLQFDLGSISTTVKRLSARQGMQVMRGRRRAEESSSVDMLPGETRAQWKERMKRRVFGNGVGED